MVCPFLPVSHGSTLLHSAGFHLLGPLLCSGAADPTALPHTHEGLPAPESRTPVPNQPSLQMTPTDAPLHPPCGKKAPARKAAAQPVGWVRTPVWVVLPSTSAPAGPVSVNSQTAPVAHDCQRPADPLTSPAGNSIGDAGASGMAQVLRDTSSLRQLDLACMPRGCLARGGGQCLARWRWRLQW